MIMTKFIKIEDVLSGETKGKVHLRGWIYRKRDQKDLVFIILRDSTGLVQLTCKGLDEAKKATIESSVEISGEIKKDSRAPGGYEIQVDDFKIIGLSERFPITKDQSEEFLRDMKHLWVRSRKMTAILKIRSEVFKAIHDFSRSKEFVEVQPPILTTSSCEGGAQQFKVEFPGKEVYLSESWQLYGEAMITSHEKIYTVIPAFRAEKSRTIRHLAEYWTAEWEWAWGTHDDMMKFEEDLIVYVIKHVLKHCEKELKELGRDLSELRSIKKPFLRITYKEAMKKLEKPQDHDITDKEERELIKKLGSKPVFLTHFPRKLKAFYMLPSKDPKVVEASDLLVPGVGEITGGSARIHDLKQLKEAMKLFKLDPKDYEWYIDLRRYGTVPHVGFGLGIERLVMWISGAKHVMDTIPFPRTMDRVYP